MYLCSAVALTCDIEPKVVVLRGTNSSEFIEFKRRLWIAEQNLGVRIGRQEPPPYGKDDDFTMVDFAQFARWVTTKAKWPVPPEFPRPAEAKADAQPMWPWGTYRTELLDHLAAAAQQFWKAYDPAKPATAPTNEVVIAWLLKRDVSDRAASAIATILRADTVKPGPRKK
jgi:hypothetical protein